MSNILKNIIPSNTWTTIQAYIANYIQVYLSSLYVFAFNASNEVSGADSVVSNGKSAKCNFSLALAPSSSFVYEISNNNIASNSSIQLTLKYDVLLPGSPVILSSKTTLGLIQVKIHNLDAGAATSGNLVVEFLILN